MGPNPPPLLPIGRHAKELIEHSQEHLQQGQEKDLIIALIHLDNAVEIMLKEHLRFNKNNSWRSIEQKFFNQLLDACEDLDTIESNKNQFVAFHDIRNSLYHAGTFAPRKEDVESALSFSKLLFNETHPLFAFKEMKIRKASDSTISFLAKEYGRNTPYVTEAKYLKKLAMLLEKNNYNVKTNPTLTGTSFMADLLATKNNEVIVIEIKARTKAKSVLNSTVFKLADYVEAVKVALPGKKVEGWLVTNTTFSLAAKKAARTRKIRLLSGDDIANLLFKDTSSYFY